MLASFAYQSILVQCTLSPYLQCIQDPVCHEDIHICSRAVPGVCTPVGQRTGWVCRRPPSHHTEDLRTPVCIYIGNSVCVQPTRSSHCPSKPETSDPGWTWFPSCTGPSHTYPSRRCRWKPEQQIKSYYGLFILLDTESDPHPSTDISPVNGYGNDWGSGSDLKSVQWEQFPYSTM